MRRRALLLLLPLVACAAPAQQAAAPAGPQRFAVFFPPWSAQLDAPAMAVVRDAAAAAKANPTAPVTVLGYAAPAGSAAANRTLSALRAQVVHDQLVADGVEAGRIRPDARGVSTLGTSEQEGRRVEIDVGS